MSKRLGSQTGASLVEYALLLALIAAACLGPLSESGFALNYKFGEFAVNSGWCTLPKKINLGNGGNTGGGGSRSSMPLSECK